MEIRERRDISWKEKIDRQEEEDMNRRGIGRTGRKAEGEINNVS